jgi:CubicO group peptidase (beta-lactamase class C family)
MRFSFLLISVFCIPISFLFFPISGLSQDLVQTEGIKTNLHKKNVKRIVFTSKRVATGELRQADFLHEYTLTNKSDLFFIAFMDNSLTNYKHRLLPGATADSLSKIGNYQFTLLVDNKEIYQSNLLPGAPYAVIQDTATIVNRPLVNNTDGTGSWSESFWNRFLRNGGDSVLTDGPHVLRMEIRAYVKTDTVITGELIAAGELKLQVLRHPKIDASKIKLNPVQPYDGFAISKEPFDTKKIKELKAGIDVGIFKKINSVVVIKNGKLLIEEYFNNESRNSLHDPRSVGKSFASTIMGIAIRDGYISSETEILRKFYDLDSFANYSDLKANTSIKELLTMSSGFDGNDDDSNSPGNEENMYPTADWVKFALDLPVRPSGDWHYFTAGVILLGDILNRKVPGGLDRYANEKLFNPLNISKYEWQYTPQHVPNTAGGIRMNALDFAKFGQLYKNGGTWNNKQIVPKDWINKTFTKQKQVPGRTNEYYGYLFWNKQYEVRGKSYEAFYCAGNGGNYILVFKDIPFVIVITASAYGQAYAHSQVTKIISEYILPAVLN